MVSPSFFSTQNQGLLADSPMDDPPNLKLLLFTEIDSWIPTKTNNVSACIPTLSYIFLLKQQDTHPTQVYHLHIVTQLFNIISD